MSENELKAAEERMNAIERKIANIESISVAATSSAAVEDSLREYQVQMLKRLKGVRDTFQSEGGDLATIKQERDMAVSENIVLKKDLEKANYRIRHLIKALEVEEAKNK